MNKCELLIKQLEFEYEQMRQYAKDEVCYSVRYEIKLEAAGFRQALDIVKSTLITRRPNDVISFDNDPKK